MEQVQLTLEERIQQIEDIENIRKIIANYCHGVDKRNLETFLSIWHEEGVWEVPHLRNAIGKKDVELLLVNTIWNNVVQSHHHTTNSVIEINGNTATAVSDILYTRTEKNGVSSLLSGVYRDDYCKDGGRWYMKRRAFSPHDTKSPLY